MGASLSWRAAEHGDLLRFDDLVGVRKLDPLALYRFYHFPQYGGGYSCEFHRLAAGRKIRDAPKHGDPLRLVERAEALLQALIVVVDLGLAELHGLADRIAQPPHERLDDGTPVLCGSLSEIPSVDCKEITVCVAQDEWHIGKNGVATARAFHEVQHTTDGLPELIGSRDAVHHAGGG